MFPSHVALLLPSRRDPFVSEAERGRATDGDEDAKRVDGIQ